MKNLLLLCAAALVFTSCAKKPEACIEASATTAEVGQPITFTDCSKNADDVTIALGDDPSNKVYESTTTYAYNEAGTYVVTLTAETDKDKEDETSITITVNQIQKSSFIGTWNQYKYGSSFDFFYFGSMDDYTPTNIDYVFTADSVKYTSNGGSYTYTEPWSLSAKGVLTIGSSTYNVTKLYSGEMIWDDGYSAYYFAKK